MSAPLYEVPKCERCDRHMFSGLDLRRFCKACEPTPLCECRACLDGKTDASGWPITMIRMFLCAKCGNKRCPHANNHANACTNSNEPGQPGSAYENCV